MRAKMPPQSSLLKTASISPHSLAQKAVRGLFPQKAPLRFSIIFGPHRGQMLLGILLLFLTNAALLLAPRLVNEAITFAEKGSVTTSIFSLFHVSPTAFTFFIALVTTALIGGFVRVFSRVVLFNVGRDVEHDLRRTLFCHLMTLSPNYFREHNTGDLMSRMTNDLGNIRLMAGFALLNIFNALLVFGTNMPLLFWLDWRVALAALAPFPLVMGLAQLLAKRMYLRTKKNQEVLGRLTSHVQENLAGQSVVRAFSRGEDENKRFQKINQESFDASMSLALIRLVMFPLMGLMGTLGIGISLYVGGLALLDGRLQTGDVVEITGRLVQLMWPATAFGFIMSVYQRGKASLVRINEILETIPDLVDGEYAAPLQGKIECRSLSMQYGENTRSILQNLSFTLMPGEVLGVVGKSGGGKSSLVKILSRQIPIKDQSLFFDDIDANNWHLGSLAGAQEKRENVEHGIALVPDDGFLFSATLKENLCFARPHATNEEIAAVVSLADLERDLEAFPHGLDTLVGERGVTLSGGQRQRVALARALLAKPRILILDDSLSAVDAETEARIVDALHQGNLFSPSSPQRKPPIDIDLSDSFLDKTTLVIISHRLSAVKKADQIIVLDEGKTAERGQHKDLIQKGGIYAELWGTELLQQALDEPPSKLQ